MGHNNCSGSGEEKGFCVVLMGVLVTLIILIHWPTCAFGHERLFATDKHRKP